jgi:hypothetical protein
LTGQITVEFLYNNETSSFVPLEREKPACFFSNLLWFHLAVLGIPYRISTPAVGVASGEYGFTRTHSLTTTPVDVFYKLV